MNWWEWMVLGAAIWVLLAWAVCVANYRFWNFIEPTERRRNGEAMYPTERAEES